MASRHDRKRQRADSRPPQQYHMSSEVRTGSTQSLPRGRISPVLWIGVVLVLLIAIIIVKYRPLTKRETASSRVSQPPAVQANGHTPPNSNVTQAEKSPAAAGVPSQPKASGTPETGAQTGTGGASGSRASLRTENENSMTAQVQPTSSAPEPKEFPVVWSVLLWFGPIGAVSAIVILWRVNCVGKALQTLHETLHSIEAAVEEARSSAPVSVAPTSPSNSHLGTDPSLEKVIRDVEKRLTESIADAKSKLSTELNAKLSHIQQQDPQRVAKLEYDLRRATEERDELQQRLATITAQLDAVQNRRDCGHTPDLLELCDTVRNICQRKECKPLVEVVGSRCDIAERICDGIFFQGPKEVENIPDTLDKYVFALPSELLVALHQRILTAKDVASIVALQSTIITELTNLGLAVIEAREGDQFDPEKHEHSEGIWHIGDVNKSGLIHRTLTRGYMWNGQVLRKALVERYL